MPTQEERITRLEETYQEFRPVLADAVLELTIVKGLIVKQNATIQELRQEMEERMAGMDEKLDTILMLLRPS